MCAICSKVSDLAPCPRRSVRGIRRGGSAPARHMVWAPHRWDRDGSDAAPQAWAALARSLAAPGGLAEHAGHWRADECPGFLAEALCASKAHSEEPEREQRRRRRAGLRRPPRRAVATASSAHGARPRVLVALAPYLSCTGTAPRTSSATLVCSYRASGRLSKPPPSERPSRGRAATATTVR